MTGRAGGLGGSPALGRVLAKTARRRTVKSRDTRERIMKPCKSAMDEENIEESEGISFSFNLRKLYKLNKILEDNLQGTFFVEVMV